MYSLARPMFCACLIRLAPVARTLGYVYDLKDA